MRRQRFIEVLVGSFYSMQGIIKQRAKERKLEFEKAEQAKRMAEALVSEESGRAMHSPLHAPRASNSPSRSSSPTLERLRTALGGNLATDGDESQRANLTLINICTNARGQLSSAYGCPPPIVGAPRDVVG